ncbi:hypothetical protein RF11_02079 [Thelohanellus kitauei]|uniref:Uncharacterized protein n=1 Tax=Thelohanellus kitauei TaxID=669202 RepID=A0A0C2MQ11_THEKT|nr:hypothetical protein RF11_02079 [Thelohanellus kitauei]
MLAWRPVVLLILSLLTIGESPLPLMAIGPAMSLLGGGEGGGPLGAVSGLLGGGGGGGGGKPKKKKPAWNGYNTEFDDFGGRNDFGSVLCDIDESVYPFNYRSPPED